MVRVLWTRDQWRIQGGRWAENRLSQIYLVLVRQNIAHKPDLRCLLLCLWSRRLTVLYKQESSWCFVHDIISINGVIPSELLLKPVDNSFSMVGTMLLPLIFNGKLSYGDLISLLSHGYRSPFIEWKSIPIYDWERNHGRRSERLHLTMQKTICTIFDAKKKCWSYGWKFTVNGLEN